ncbi:MAG: orotidine-5'-phosphate decarboxylase [bacterium]
MTVDNRDRLICALDFSTVEEAKALVNALGETVVFYKIGLELFSVSGLSLVNWLKERRKKVFMDLKFFDVENTVKRAVARVAEAGADFLTVHGNETIIKAAVEGRGKADLKLLAVTVLTCLDAEDIKGMGFACPVERLVLYRAGQAVTWGCDGVVASGHEAGKIKEATRGKLLVVTPGIRPGNKGHHEHKRAMTPEEAVASGADYLVVGRPFREAENPAEMASYLFNQISQGLCRK